MTEWWDEDEDEIRWKPVGSASEWTDGSARQVAIGARRIGVWRVDRQTWYALKDVCPHAGAKLSAGVSEERCAVCPKHGWRFDLATGQGPDGSRVATYPVRIAEDGTVEIGI